MAVGIVGVCWEVTSGSYYAPGVIGLGLIAWSAYQLSLHHPTLQGLGIILIAFFLFVIEFFARIPHVYGLLATALLSIGTHLLFTRGQQIGPIISIVVPLVIGGLVTYSVAVAGYARRAKRLSCYNSD